VGHEDALVIGGGRQHLFVVEPFERRLLVEGAHLEPMGLESPADAWPRDVRVEQ
jgi:hypothetical protein